MSKNNAIEVLKKFVKDCNECCVDDVPYRQPVEDAINKAILALEQKEKLKELFSNELLERIIQDAYEHGIGSVEIDLRQLWEEIKKLEEGVEK